MIILWLKKAWDRVWAWLKENWKYVLFPIGILLALLALFRRKQEVIAPEIVEAEEAKIRERKKAELKLEKAETEKKKTIEEVEKEHQETISKLTRAQRDRVKELQEDPDELNSFLLSIGESIEGKQ